MVLSYRGYYYRGFFSLPRVISSLHTPFNILFQNPHFFTFINTFTEPWPHSTSTSTTGSISHRSPWLSFYSFLKKSVNSAGCLLTISHILGKKRFLVCGWSRCHVIQSPLGISGGLISTKAPKDTQIRRCSGPLCKMYNICR